MSDMYRAHKPARAEQPGKHNYLLTDLNILKLPRLPARLTSEETAFLLRIEKQDIPWIVEADILTPCGEPAETAQKWFCTADVLNLADSPDALSEMTKVISDRWAKKNARRKKRTQPAKNVGDEIGDEPKTGGH
jgi:hypothetical protein